MSMTTGFNDIALDNNPLSTTYKDITIVNGDLPTVSGTAAILQNILQTLSVFLGEWFLNTNLGIDYFGSVLTKNPSQKIINAIFINQILSVPGVTNLTAYSFAVNAATRSIAIAFTAQTTQGIVNYTGTLPTGTVIAAGVPT
jgi:hypothetical protein